MWETLCATGQKLKRSCPVCLEEFDAGLDGAVLRCGHLYCSKCSKQMFFSAGRKSQQSCPLCRLHVHSAADIVDLKEFAAGRENAAEAAKELEILESPDGQHGSKLHAVAQVLRGILANKDERAIIFCQFADLELQISKALTDIGIEHARLSAARDIFEQTAVLDSFQQLKDRSRVLLLSLEQSASGTNLTAANHVLLIHPMAASTAERAVAFEQQAIGRCVRLGQKRTVTVWRFVTKDTVEDLLDHRFSEQRCSYGVGPLPRAVPKKSAKPVKRRSEPSGAAREAVLVLRRGSGPSGSNSPGPRSGRTSQRGPGPQG